MMYEETQNWGNSHSGDVLPGEGIRRVADEKACLTDGSGINKNHY